MSCPLEPLAHRCTFGAPAEGPSPQVCTELPCPKPTLCLSLLQYACGIQAEVVGKPSPEFFKSALREMGVEAHQVGRPQGAQVWQVWGLRQPCQAGGRKT